MDRYFVNKEAQVTGEHEVHKDGCLNIPVSYNRHYLGYFYSCHGAVVEARKEYNNVDGCYYCCIECHTK